MLIQVLDDKPTSPPRYIQVLDEKSGSSALTFRYKMTNQLLIHTYIQVSDEKSASPTYIQV